MNLLIRLLVNALLIILIGAVVPGIHVSGIGAAIIAVIALAIVNVTLKPLLFILTLPITLLTLGLFTFVINALMLWFVGSIIKGFTVDGFIPALLGALIISLGHIILNSLERKNS